jgi:NitT/TauT family transport system ATP-binding protein
MDQDIQVKVVIENLYKAFEERRIRKRNPEDCFTGEDCQVFNNLSFSIKPGGLTCFLGPSGCGKSTLLRIIAGFEKPSSGNVVIDGAPVKGPSSSHIFVFQEDGLFPWMTARENVAIGAKRFKSNLEREHQIEEFLELVGLSGFEDHYPHELSGGMRRRAEVARALITNPDILFMDEPFSALDFVTRLQMREEMLNVHAMFPSTILFITHDIDEAIQLGDQIVVLSERPACVKADIPLPYPHPRDITQVELSKLRKEIYFLMGLHAAL